MGLAEFLLGKDNPFAQWTGQNQNFLGAIGAGLAQGQNIQSGLSAGLAQVPQAKQLDREVAEKVKAEAKVVAQTNATKQWLAQNYPDLAQAVDAGLPVSDAWSEAFRRKNAKTAAPQNPYMNAGDGTFFNWQTGEFLTGPNAGDDNAAALKTGFTPIWGEYNGQPTIALPGNDGRLYIDGQPIDPGDFIPTNPYDLNALKAGGTAFGKGTGGAQFSVPNAQLELDQSKAALSNLKTDPAVVAGMDDWFKQFGALPRGMWVQGGSNMAQFRNAANNVIDRSWLSARAALKGGGQITDYEGAKAENAVSMMKSALDSGDKAQFEAARDDYEYWIGQGFAKLQQQAGAMQGYGGGQQQPPPPPAAGDDVEAILNGMGL